ncbi:MAG: hypothetical protein RRB13_15910 [bacterium]|nr:hypothetical protein [bacterium]
MALKGIFSKKKAPTPAAQGKTKKAAAPKAASLSSLFAPPLDLPEKLREQLLSSAEQGAKRFAAYNQNRLELALSSFDAPMKQALFDIIYLLHINDPSLSEVRYSTKEVIDYKEKEVEKVADLYVPGAPAGVAGLDAMGEPMKSELMEHLGSTFEVRSLPGSGGHNPIMGIFSIGSIGTIGHKALASDLDLQVLYRIEPFLVEISSLNEENLKSLLGLTLKFIARKVQKQNKISNEQLTRNPNMAGKIQQLARRRLQQAYPLLYAQFISKEVDLITRLSQSPVPKLRTQLINETIKLYNTANRLNNKKANAEAEAALRLKIDRIQAYVASRYPSAEIWLFPMSDEDMKQGNFRSTLESKESSGSAYELILTYDTLMPGVYFTPVMPSHFLFDRRTNNDQQYDKLVDYMRFGLLDPLFGEYKNLVSDQGRTPDLTQDYVGSHNGAIYWEAFKASSGNLPKAMMNLMRYETLLHTSMRATIIQLIKVPERMDELVDRINTGAFKEVFLPKNMLELEKDFPHLAYDPWWVRYKALKIAYLEKQIPDVNEAEQIEISHILDLAFALHVRISDVFGLSKPETHRQKVLHRFLDLAFPQGSSQRRELDNISIGDIREVTQFEQAMRRIFKRCINRIAKRLDDLGIQDERELNQEFLIWYHYYKKNFEPQENVIQPTILQHLKVPRGRVLAGFEKGRGWFFKAFQKHTVRGFGGEKDLLSHLPEETDLIDHSSFLKGLAHCIANGYYGVVNKGTLKESFTSLELVGTHMDLGDEMDNDLAYVQPGQIEQLMRQIQAFFPQQKVDYRACLQEKLQITEVFLFVNLLHFGGLSLLFRNNLGSLMVEERSVPKFHAKAKYYHQNYKEFYADKSLHQELETFFSEHDIQPENVKLWVWVNHNSFETHHPLTNQARKEQDLNRELRLAFLERLLPPHEPGQAVRYDNLENLKKTIFCGALVAAIDGEVSSKEYRVCTEYLDAAWQSRWGSEDETFTLILKDLTRFLSAGSQLNKNIGRLAEELKMLLTLGQQQALLDLMQKMAQFDQKNIQNKQAVIETFDKAFNLPHAAPY